MKNGYSATIANVSICVHSTYSWVVRLRCQAFCLNQSKFYCIFVVIFTRESTNPNRSIWQPLESRLDACLSLSSVSVPAFFFQDNECSENERKFRELPPNKTKLLTALEQDTSFPSISLPSYQQRVRTWKWGNTENSTADCCPVFTQVICQTEAARELFTWFKLHSSY
jgi:hypothetical protein